MKHTLLYGAHMSIAGGLENAIIDGQSIGCTAIQLFTKSNRQWASNPLTELEIETFKKTASKSTISSIVAHTAYLINIGSLNTEIQKKSASALVHELDRCNQLEIPYLVLHPGSAVDSTEQQCLDTITTTLNTIFDKHPGTTNIALELMSGQGSTVGHTFETLAYLIDHIENKPRISICFDTCHAWAAGYDFSTQETYNAMWNQFDTTIGLDKLSVIHINDSKLPLNSRVDRHETIGKGTIGLDAFSYIMNDKRLFDIPKILETPKDSLLDDVHNMQTLKNLLTPATQKALQIS